MLWITFPYIDIIKQTIVDGSNYTGFNKSYKLVGSSPGLTI